MGGAGDGLGGGAVVGLPLLGGGGWVRGGATLEGGGGAALRGGGGAALLEGGGGTYLLGGGCRWLGRLGGGEGERTKGGGL